MQTETEKLPVDSLVNEIDRIDWYNKQFFATSNIYISAVVKLIEKIEKKIKKKDVIKQKVFGDWITRTDYKKTCDREIIDFVKKTHDKVKLNLFESIRSNPRFSSDLSEMENQFHEIDFLPPESWRDDDEPDSKTKRREYVMCVVFGYSKDLPQDFDTVIDLTERQIMEISKIYTQE